jgi:hypothetical protein
MTGYFSTSIKGLQGVYSITTYWVTFAVVVALSILTLFFSARMLFLLRDFLERLRRMFVSSLKLPRYRIDPEDDIELGAARYV